MTQTIYYKVYNNMFSYLCVHSDVSEIGDVGWRQTYSQDVGSGIPYVCHPLLEPYVHYTDELKNNRNFKVKSSNIITTDYHY